MVKQSTAKDASKAVRRSGRGMKAPVRFRPGGLASTPEHVMVMIHEVRGGHRACGPLGVYQTTPDNNRPHALLPPNPLCPSNLRPSWRSRNLWSRCSRRLQKQPLFALKRRGVRCSVSGRFLGFFLRGRIRARDGDTHRRRWVASSARLPHRLQRPCNAATPNARPLPFVRWR